MNILVFVKQVPETNKVEVDEETGVLKRSGVKGKLNPFDLYAVETAVSLKEAYGGSVHTLTMGPPQAEEALLETVYMGADGGILVTDRRVAGSDVLATSYTLSQAARSAGSRDLYICGKQTTDGDTAQVGAEVAEFLDIPHAANVVRILEADSETVTVLLNQEAVMVTQKMPLPCLLCMDAGINTPRLPSYKRKKACPEDAVKVLTLDDLPDHDETHYGLAGSATRVERIFPPDRNDVREMFRGDADELSDKLFELLINERVLN